MSHTLWYELWRFRYWSRRHIEVLIRRVWEWVRSRPKGIPIVRLVGIIQRIKCIMNYPQACRFKLFAMRLFCARM
jgi:hypothetical protein